MDIELDSLRPVGGLLGLDGVMDDVKDLAILGVSAGAGYMSAEAVAGYVPYVKEQSNLVKGLVQVAGGIAAGVAIGRFNGTVGAGFGAGMVGAGVARLAKNFVPGLAGLGEGEELLLGLDGNITASDWNPIPGQVDGVIETEPGIAAWGG